MEDAVYQSYMSNARERFLNRKSDIAHQLRQLADKIDEMSPDDGTSGAPSPLSYLCGRTAARVQTEIEATTFNSHVSYLTSLVAEISAVEVDHLQTQLAQATNPVRPGA
jgi:hypothetical protein